VAEVLLDETTLKNYFCLTAESPESIVHRPEFDHLVQISSVDPRWWKPLSPFNERDFKESDARWLYLNAVGQHYETLASTDDEAGITVEE
jgi:hypothetical protein